ncbi:MAG: hypothetical protein AB2A00_29080 [Myxococcota bacterium]
MSAETDPVESFAETIARDLVSALAGPAPLKLHAVVDALGDQGVREVVAALERSGAFDGVERGHADEGLRAFAQSRSQPAAGMNVLSLRTRRKQS